MSGTKRLDPKRITVGPGRIAWNHIDPPEETPDGPRYRMTLLVPPGSKDPERILEICEDLCRQAWGADPKDWPALARLPKSVVRRCEEKPQYAGYEKGWHFFSVSSPEKPGIVGYDPNVPVLDPKELYNGRWAKISVRPFVYDKKSVGVALGLSNIQLLKNDTVFGRTAPRQDFDVEAEAVGEDF